MIHTELLAIAIISATLLPPAASAANRHQSYDELTAASDKVVLGTVGVKSSHWADDSLIYTDVVVSPDVTVKGAEEGAVVVRVLGGTVGDTRMAVSDGPEFPEGERVVLFLKRDAERFRVVGRAAGSIRASSPDAADALEGAFSEIERTSRQRLTHKRGLAGSYLSLSSRTAQPLARSGATAAAVTTVGCYSVDGAKWGVASATYKIGVYIPANWSPSIDASTATWNSVGAGFRLLNDPGSTNELSYIDLVAKYGSSYANTYAVTTTWSSVSTSRISKATIEINTKWAWSIAGEPNMADVQNILTHEFGHWMRLLDIYSPSTCSEVTMWGTAPLGEIKKRTLEQSDIDGFLSLYGGGSALGAPVLTAPANGAAGVSVTPTLTWSGVSGASSYDVYFGTASAPPLVTSVTGTAFQPGTLSAGVTYYWRIVARDASNSASSAVYSFTTAGGSVSGPTLLSPAIQATGVSLTPVMQWTAVPGATVYDLYIGTNPSPSRIGTVSSTSVTVSGFRSGVTYYWKVVARSSTASSSSDVWSFRTR
jgi:hypothetical protein